MKFLNLLIVLFLFYNFFGGSRSSSCGDLRDISYPYHLPGTCKLKAYELQCDGNDTVLYIGATKYLVKDVSIKNKTLRVLDPELAIGGCHLPSKSLSWGSNILTWYSSYASSNFIYFFNCTHEVEDSMYKLIDCMDGPRSRVYALNTFNIEVQSTPKSCRYVGSTAANSEVQKRWNNTDGVEIMQMLRQGFVVSWDQGSIDESCPRLQDCWTLSKIRFEHQTVDFSNASTTGTVTVYYSTTGYQLFEFLYVQPSFLECIYNTQGSEMYANSNSRVVFGFMLILLALSDILLLLLDIATHGNLLVASNNIYSYTSKLKLKGLMCISFILLLYEEQRAQRWRVATTEKWEMLKPLYNLHLKLEE
ncbi:putative serine/threonine-protein kinase [Carex littledalei]|uniref:Putative serine/threonine-protein kinase n=1 Tax=Carex littledalei TaxID=544730 RepID=A0A833QU70_9POAL|nr:putative serine/threonine-protein kinase [Carex littledalei]